MRYNDLDKFFNGVWLVCIPYSPVDKKGLIKFDDVVITRIKGIKSQFFYKGYNIQDCNMPPPIQTELFDKLPDIIKQFYKIIKNEDWDTKTYYNRFMEEYNYFKETGRTTWL